MVAGMHRKTLALLVFIALGMLSLGFASKPLYDTFCRLTGYGGTPGIADANLSEVIDREATVYFDANVSGMSGWEFRPEARSIDVQVGASALAFYEVTNTTDEPLVGTATFNVTPIKGAPYFIKTECFCFTEQRVEPGESVTMPVLFHIDPQIDDEARLADVRDFTLSYTFFPVEEPATDGPRAAVRTSGDAALN